MTFASEDGFPQDPSSILGTFETCGKVDGCAAAGKEGDHGAGHIP